MQNRPLRLLFPNITLTEHMKLPLRFYSFLLCLVVLALRGWDRILHPGIWAEDSTAFLSDALSKGWTVIFQPYEGYFHTFNRLAMQLFLLFPLHFLPALITTTCFILYAWVMSIFVDKSYRYLVQSDLIRVLIAAGLCILPGSYEILGNLCNTHRILATYLLFLGIRSSQEKYKPQQLLAAFVVAASAGEVLTFLPIFFYRIYLRLKQDPKIKVISKEILLISVILVCSALNVLARKTNTTHLTYHIHEVIRATFAAFTFNFASQPLIGWRFAGNLFGHVPFLYWGIVAVFSTILIRDCWLSRKTERFSVYIAIACLFGTQELSWIVRPGDILVYKEFFPSMWWGTVRMVYPLAFAGFFVWCLYFSRVSKMAGIGFILLYFTLSDRLTVPSYGDNSSWEKTAADLERSIKTGCPKQVRVNTFPDGWHFDYQSPLAASALNCHE